MPSRPQSRICLRIHGGLLLAAGLALGICVSEAVAAPDKSAGDKGGKDKPVEFEIPHYEPPEWLFRSVGGPHRKVRTLVQLQDSLARGDATAHQRQQALIAEIAKEFASATAEDLQAPANQHAAVIYLLSGGNPDALRERAAELAAEGPVADAFKGALAYADGALPEAYGSFNKLDPLSLPSTVGGRVALVHGIILEAVDARKAAQTYDMAMLLAPGSLVEEAALRRAIPLALAARNFPRAFQLFSRYLRRFSSSAFADGFLAEQIEPAARALTGHDDRIDALRDVMALASPKQRKSFLLGLARSGISSGNLTLARRMSERVAEEAPGESREAQRAAIYDASARIASGEVEAGIARLADVAQDTLSVQDQRLAAAAERLAKTITEPVVAEPAPEPQQESPPAGPPPETAGTLPEEELPEVVLRARKLLAQTEGVLQSAGSKGGAP